MGKQFFYGSLEISITMITCFVEFSQKVGVRLLIGLRGTVRVCALTGIVFLLCGPQGIALHFEAAVLIASLVASCSFVPKFP